MSKSIAATAAIAVVLLIGAPAKQAGAIGGRTCDEHCRRLWALGLPLASSLGRVPALSVLGLAPSLLVGRFRVGMGWSRVGLARSRVGMARSWVGLAPRLVVRRAYDCTARLSAVTNCVRASGSESPRGAKACRSRKNPVSAKASARSAAAGATSASRRKAGRRISLSR